MANLDEALASSNPALKQLGGLIGAVADFSGVVSAAEWIISLVRPDDEVQDLLNAVLAALESLEGLIAAGDWQIFFDEIDNVKDPARQVFQQLPSLIQAQLTPADVEDYLTTCGTAIQHFLDPDSWRFPYYPAAYAAIDDVTVGPRPDGTGRAFIHGYVLPVFVQTIFYYLATVKALAPHTITNADRVELIEACADQLDLVYRTIVAGNPAAGDIANGGDPPGIVGFPFADAALAEGEALAAKSLYGPVWPPGWPESGPRSNFDPFWNEHGRNYGAVEQYSAIQVIDQYPVFFDAAPLQTAYPGYPPFEYDAVAEVLPDQQWTAVYAPELTKLALRIWQRQKRAVELAGIPTIRDTINRLNAMVLRPAMPTRHEEDWSVREICHLLAPLDLPASPSALRYIGAFLDTTNPTPPNGQNHLDHGRCSLRAMLAGPLGW